ncbi:MAG: N-acetylmuramoyl-L-alanine amidase [Xanthobacteraceae bacterium]
MSIRAKCLVALALGAALLAGLGPAAPAGGNAVAAPAVPGKFPVASDVRIGGDENQTRFVMDLSGKVDLRAFALADPYRVVIDLPQVTFQLPAKVGESGRGLIKAFRYGLVIQGASRIVIDVVEPVRIEKSFVLDAAEGHPARLVVDLAAIDRETFLSMIAQDNKATAPPSKTPDAETATSDPRPLIMLDPGHGGIDNGTHASSGESEKDIVLNFALLLRDKIEQLGNYRVAMTRTEDVFVPLTERVRLARVRQASLFISIHADALGRGEGSAQGAAVYTLSETASDAEAARLAEAENRADVIAGVDLSREPDDVADILIDLARRETKTFSVQFARTLVNEMKSATRLHKRPLKSAGFIVLKAPDVPSVLLELGFVSNRQDLKQLTSRAWQTRTAGAIAQAVDSYVRTRMAGAPAASDRN